MEVLEETMSVWEMGERSHGKVMLSEAQELLLYCFWFKYLTFREKTVNGMIIHFN